MDDKKLDDILARVDKSLDGMDKSLREIVEYMQQLRTQAQRDLEEKVEHLRQLTTRQPLMSGRWHRRDGDNFPIVPPSSIDAANAEIVRQVKEQHEREHGNSPPGDIRPSK